MWLYIENGFLCVHIIVFMFQHNINVPFIPLVFVLLLFTVIANSFCVLKWNLVILSGWYGQYLYSFTSHCVSFGFVQDENTSIVPGQ